MKPLSALAPRALKLLVVGVPLILAALYLGLIAADRYVSESTVSVRRASSDASAIPGAALLLAGVSPPATQDTLVLTRYLHSLALLLRLDQELGLRAHYASETLDLPFRLAPDSSQEQFLHYWRQRVQVSFDTTTSLLTVRVQAFDPVFAQKVNQRLLDESEKFVNESSHQIAREQLRFAEGEAKTAGDRVEQARDKLLAFQSKNRLLDPTAQARASGTITAELQGSLARREAELKGLLAYLNDAAPQVRSLRGEIKALQEQIEAERNRATTDNRASGRLTALAAEFQGLELRAQFALDAYKLALGAVENARIEATRKLKSLVVVEPPSLAQTAEYPLRLYNLVTVLVASLLLYAIVRLVLATIREHQD